MFFQTTRSWLGPYSSFSRLMVGPTREQKGHWKSLISTTVTRASGLPHCGSWAVTGTGAALWSRAPCPADSSAAIWTPALRSMPYMRAIPARKLRMNPTIAVPLFI